MPIQIDIRNVYDGIGDRAVGAHFVQKMNEAGQPIPSLTMFDDPSDHEYEVLLRNAFNFMRRNSAGRYSASALMRIQNAADQLADYGVQDPGVNLPYLYVVQQPGGYDELTEVKNGGIGGMVIAWPDRSLIAVQPSLRRRGLGSVLLASTLGWTPSRSRFWVARTNRDGQLWLLRNGLTPQSMNGRGAMCFALDNADSTDDEAINEREASVPFDEAPVRGRRPRRQVLAADVPLGAYTTARPISYGYQAYTTANRPLYDDRPGINAAGTPLTMDDLRHMTTQMNTSLNRAWVEELPSPLEPDDPEEWRWPATN